MIELFGEKSFSAFLLKQLLTVFGYLCFTMKVLLFFRSKTTHFSKSIQCSFPHLILNVSTFILSIYYASMRLSTFIAEKMREKKGKSEAAAKSII